MGFRIKVAPGVRVRVSSRGVRAGIGPRAARIHVGSGRTGFSTGVGPFSAYTSVGGSRRRRSSPRRGPSASSIAAYERELRQQARAQEISAVANLCEKFDRFCDAHLERFETASKPIATLPSPATKHQLQKGITSQLLGGVSRWRRGDRRLARRQARALAETQAADAAALDQSSLVPEQRLLDLAWGELVANDPQRVLAEVEDAFADNDAPAAPIDCEGESLTLLMRFPHPDAIVPARHPSMTAGGKPTVAGFTKTERNGLYLRALASHTLATVREALATAPGIRTTLILVVRGDKPNTLEPIYAGHFERAIERLIAPSEDPVDLLDSFGGILNIKGRTRELAPIDLADEPDIAAVLAKVRADAS